MASPTTISFNELSDLQKHVINNNIPESQKILAAGGRDTPIKEPIKIDHVCFGVGSTAIHMVQSPAMLQILINYKADVNSRDTSGKTPLHLAVKPDVAKALLYSKANPLLQDKDGNTPLHLARNATTTKMLLEHGVNPNFLNNDGATPLFRVFCEGRANCLIEAKADVSHRRFDGMTPLHLARSPKIVECLVAKKADVNAQRDDGFTPLHWSRNGLIAQKLLDYEADVNAKAKNGQTPLHTAKDYGVVLTLLRANADVNAKDRMNRTPLQCSRSPEIAQVLQEHGAVFNTVELASEPPAADLWSSLNSLDTEIEDNPVDEGAPTTFPTSPNSSLSFNHATALPLPSNESLLESVKRYKLRHRQEPQGQVDPTTTEAYQILLHENEELKVEKYRLKNVAGVNQILLEEVSQLETKVAELETRIKQFTQREQELQRDRDNWKAKHDELETNYNRQSILLGQCELKLRELPDPYDPDDDYDDTNCSDVITEGFSRFR